MLTITPTQAWSAGEDTTLAPVALPQLSDALQSILTHDIEHAQQQVCCIDDDHDDDDDNGDDHHMCYHITMNCCTQNLVHHIHNIIGHQCIGPMISLTIPCQTPPPGPPYSFQHCKTNSNPSSSNTSTPSAPPCHPQNAPLSPESSIKCLQMHGTWATSPS